MVLPSKGESVVPTRFSARAISGNVVATIAVFAALGASVHAAATPVQGRQVAQGSQPGSPIGVPELLSLRLDRSTIRAARGGTSIAGAPVGTMVRYVLSLPGMVDFGVDRARMGRKEGRRCVRPRRRNRLAKRCTRWVELVGSFYGYVGEEMDPAHPFALDPKYPWAGMGSLHFTGRFGGISLPPGRFRLVAVGSQHGVPGRSKPKRAEFRVVHR